MEVIVYAMVALVLSFGGFYFAKEWRMGVLAIGWPVVVPVAIATSAAVEAFYLMRAKLLHRAISKRPPFWQNLKGY